MSNKLSLTLMSNSTLDATFLMADAIRNNYGFGQPLGQTFEKREPRELLEAVKTAVKKIPITRGADGSQIHQTEVAAAEAVTNQKGTIHVGELAANALENSFGHKPENFVEKLIWWLNNHLTILFKKNSPNRARIVDIHSDIDRSKVWSLVHKLSERSDQPQMYKVLEARKHTIDLLDSSNEPRKQEIYDGHIEVDGRAHKLRVIVRLDPEGGHWLEKTSIQVDDSNEYNLENEMRLGCGTTQTIIEPFMAAATES